MTEKLLTGTLSLNTNKQDSRLKSSLGFYVKLDQYLFFSFTLYLQCVETYMGQQIYKLVVTGVGGEIGATLLYELPRKWVLITCRQISHLIRLNLNFQDHTELQMLL